MFGRIVRAYRLHCERCQVSSAVNEYLRSQYTFRERITGSWRYKTPTTRKRSPYRYPSDRHQVNKGRFL